MTFTAVAELAAPGTSTPAALPRAEASAASAADGASSGEAAGSGATGAVAGAGTAPPVIALPPTDPGYHLVSTNGDVTPFGSARFGGSALTTTSPVVATARSTGDGYWQAAEDGAVYSFGEAAFHGSASGQALRAPITSMAATPSGGGYWLVAEDGGVFAFGDASWSGSLAGLALNQPVVDLAPTPSGRGYWLVTADGGVFAFGDASPLVSLADTPLMAPIVAAAPSPSGLGLTLSGADGGVFALGDAPWKGSAVGSPGAHPIVDVDRSHSGEGYWLVAADGGVFAFGDAPFLGSAGDRRKLAPVVGIAGGLDSPGPAGEALTSRYGHDISWPQCDGPMPAPPYGHGIVGVTGGRPFSTNRCLGVQHEWSLTGGSGAGLYVNIAAPRGDTPEAADGPRGTCASDDRRCRSYNYGANTIAHALGYAAAQGASAPMWWLDVEEANYWSSDLGANQDVVLGAIEALEEAGLEVGVYSTPRMWRRLTGDMQVDLPVWVAGAPSDEAAPRWCGAHRSFGGGEVWLVQSLPIRFDVNWACDALTAEPSRALRFRR